MTKKTKYLILASVILGLLCGCTESDLPSSAPSDEKIQETEESAADESESAKADESGNRTPEAETGNDTEETSEAEDEESVPEEKPVFKDRANATEGTGSPKELNEGDVAPDFTVELAGGDSLTLSDYDDRIVLLNFWATWCPPCVREMPAFENLYHDMGDEVLILGINCMEPESDVDDFLKDFGYTYPIGYDENGVIGDYYPTDGIPYTLVIDHGIIERIFIGASDADEMYLEYSSAIEECR
ncbi:MAG: TlpA family protein disulfide reductase [Lachnospiraceae bacterium]|nr:TlpA family protein disulfide reductase [Lachnospiraceae bacterium]